jgi:hypothetical protein
MNPISNLVGRRITPTDKHRKAETITLLACPTITSNKRAKPYSYEDEVFAFLCDHKMQLGIQTIMRFQSLVVDGAILLLDGRRFAIEIKYRMNWLKACQCNWQFRKFLQSTDEAQKNPVHGAIVFFNEFSGDWNKKSQKAVNLWGAEAWYLSHHDVEGKPMDLLKLKDGTLEGYPFGSC